MTNGAISINGEKVNDINSIIVDTYFIENTYIVIKGKKTIILEKEIKMKILRKTMGL
ncbi:MAG: hypothetical protein ACLS9A_06540 [Clostridia bacterium]